jgi:hypothetical protein
METQHSQHGSPWGPVACGQQRARERGRHTHVGIMVVDLYHDAGWLFSNADWLTKNLNLIENQGLVPGGIQGVLHHHCLLALVQEGDDRVGICRG